MSFDLPPALTAALQRLSDGVSRRDLADRAASISDTYRSGGTSKPIVSRADALAYALVRMPATYAAVAACLAALTDARPDFAPATLLDVGAGPGTAAWAAMNAFPKLNALSLIDANSALRQLALELIAYHPPMATAKYLHGSAQTLLKDSANADLVCASYVLGEISERDRGTFVDQLITRTRNTLLVVEPGTPAGYTRIITLREQLIAAGMHVVAPCPHDAACPLISPDWCHFAQRLPRSRDHKQLKRADMPFEDEKFSYVILSREAVENRMPRVIGPPQTGKAVISVKLCSESGAHLVDIPRRDKAGYAAARRWRWGDAVPLKPEIL